MTEWMIYLLKVAAGIGIVILPYYLFLREDPNLLVKRIYLLAGVSASWMIPLVTFSKPEVFSGITPVVFIDPGSAIHPPVPGGNLSGSPGPTLPWSLLAVVIYVAGIAVMLFKDLFLFIKWEKQWRKADKTNGIAFTENDQVFTLYSRIFVPESYQHRRDLLTILLHEKAHIDQLHFLDLILMEITILFTWFNPFTWLVSSMIKENHEQMADRKVLSTGIHPGRYKAQLLNQTLGVNVFRLGHRFNHSLTFKRFNMMKKPVRSFSGVLKITMMATVVLVLLGFAMARDRVQKTVHGKVVYAATGDPAAGASVIIRGTTMGTVTDQYGNFKLEVEGDPEIAISFVGYRTLSVHASKIRGKSMKLSEKPFVMDPDLSTGLPSVNEDNSTVGGRHPDGEKGVRPDNDASQVILEDMPAFPGGPGALRSYIDSHLAYPETPGPGGISGEVRVEFDVTRSGKLEDLRVKQSTNNLLNKTALDLFAGMPPWEPGIQRGNAVKVHVVVPVRFNSGQE